MKKFCLSIVFMILLAAQSFAAVLVSSPNGGEDASSAGFAATVVRADVTAYSKQVAITGATPVSTPVVVPANVKIDVRNGGYFTYSGSGAITFAAGSVVEFVRPEWWGAKPDGVTDCSTAINRALATGMSVKLSAGTYYTGTTTIAMPLGNARLTGAGRDITNIKYAGSTRAILVGDGTTFTYNAFLSGFSVECTSKPSTVDGIKLDRSIHFYLDDIVVRGANNPNLVETLRGNGIHVTNSSFIGEVHHVDARKFNNGMFFETLDDSAANWAAAIVVSGHGELADNNFGVVIGNTTSNFGGSGITIRDTTIEGNWLGGVLVRSGNQTVIRDCYIEANGNYDIEIGFIGGPTVIGTVISGTTMSTEDITSPYGATPYLYKVHVVKGFTTIIENNMMSISTSIPLVKTETGADYTIVRSNRLNSTLTARYTDLGTNSVFRDNVGDPKNLHVAASLLNSWATASGYTAPYYLKTADGEIVLGGAADTGLVSTTMFILPAGFRPGAKLAFAVGQAANAVSVGTDGVVTVTVKGSSVVTMDGVRFFAAQ